MFDIWVVSYLKRLGGPETFLEVALVAVISESGIAKFGGLRAVFIACT